MRRPKPAPFAATPRAGGRGTASPGRTPRRRAPILAARYLEPMKALGVTAVPDGDWLLEIKFDGYRTLSTINEGAAELWSRNENSLSPLFPEIAAAVAGLPCSNATLDGEVVAIDETGRPRFQLLQRLGRGLHRPPLLYYVFDLVHLNGKSLLSWPIEERKAALARLLDRAQPPLRLSPTFEQAPADLLQQVRRQGLEGIVAKKPGSLYEPGRRSGQWVKCRVVHEQEFVVGGYTPPRGSRTIFGALVLGYYEGNRLRYAGKVGTGFDETTRAALMRDAKSLRVGSTPFADPPIGRRGRFGGGLTSADVAEITWLRPRLVVQVRFSEWTHDGQLRQPVFLGLRRDKDPREVVREVAAT